MIFGISFKGLTIYTQLSFSLNHDDVQPPKNYVNDNENNDINSNNIKDT